MQHTKTALIELLVHHQALLFGDFTLKSGRKCPYFINFGALSSGKALAQLGQSYAEAILQQAPSFDVLFGAAYKGIPLVIATVYALAQLGHDVAYAFNRKEAKDHGEGGQLVGSAVTNKRVLVIDDLITAGTAMRHSIELLQKSQAKIVGITVAIDRGEKGQTTQSAMTELAHEFTVPVMSILSIHDIVAYLKAQGKNTTVQLIENYLKEYGGHSH